MTDLLTTTEDRTLTDRFFATRGLTESLAAPLSAEDQTVQSMPDVSPTKWHRAHTTWFFETFLLGPTLPGYRPFHPAFGYLFNSYYEGVGRPAPAPRPRARVPARGRRDRRLPPPRRRGHDRAARGPAPTRPPSASSSWASNTSSSTRSCCSWTSSTCCRATRSAPPTTPLLPGRRPRRPLLPPGPSIAGGVHRDRPCRRRLRLRQRAAPPPRPSSGPSPWPTGR